MTDEYPSNPLSSDLTGNPLNSLQFNSMADCVQACWPEVIGRLTGHYPTDMMWRIEELFRLMLKHAEKFDKTNSKEFT